MQQRRRRAHAVDPLDPAHQPLVEALRPARDELELGVADEPVGELRDRRAEAAVGDLDGEQQRYADGDPDEREQLLDRPRAQRRR